jgi:hypothetical protein
VFEVGLMITVLNSLEILKMSLFPIFLTQMKIVLLLNPKEKLSISTTTITALI